MKMFSAEQLNSLSKEELVNAVLQAQSDYSILLERLMSFNANTFDRKSEKMENGKRISASLKRPWFRMNFRKNF